MQNSPDLPRYRPNPTRMTVEGVKLFEQARITHIPNYDLYTKEGYRPIGGVSQYDPFILRRGKVPHVQGARNFAGEQVIDQLQEKYRRRGKRVEIIAEKGAVFVKKGRRQKDISSLEHFIYHDAGITFYVKDAPQKRGLESAVVAQIEVVETLASLFTFPRKSMVKIHQ